MAAKAGYLTTVKRGGTPTAFTGEAASLVVGTTATYQIDDASKRVWDRATVPAVSDGGASVTPVATDYLFGTVTLSAPASGAVTIDGSYLPLSNVGGAYRYALNLGGDLGDCTDYESAQANGGFRSRLYQLGDVSATVGRWDDLTASLRDAWINRASVLLEIHPGGAGDKFRGWFVPESDNHSGDIGALEEDELSFQLDGEPEAGKSLGFGT